MAGLTTLADLQKRNLAAQGVAPSEPAVKPIVEPTVEPAAELTPELTPPKPVDETGSEHTSSNLKTSLQENMFSNEQEKLDAKKHVNKKTSLHVNNAPGSTAGQAEGETEAMGELLDELRTMVKAPLINHACRAPGPLVEAADAYMAENWRLKVKKQDLMARALALLTYEMRTGKPLILLGNEAALGLEESGE